MERMVLYRAYVDMTGITRFQLTNALRKVLPGFTLLDGQNDEGCRVNVVEWGTTEDNGHLLRDALGMVHQLNGQNCFMEHVIVATVNCTCPKEP